MSEEELSNELPQAPSEIEPDERPSESCYTNRASSLATESFAFLRDQLSLNADSFAELDEVVAAINKTQPIKLLRIIPEKTYLVRLITAYALFQGFKTPSDGDQLRERLAATTQQNRRGVMKPARLALEKLFDYSGSDGFKRSRDTGVLLHLETLGMSPQAALALAQEPGKGLDFLYREHLKTKQQSERKAERTDKPMRSLKALYPEMLKQVGEYGLAVVRLDQATPSTVTIVFAEKLGSGFSPAAMETVRARILRVCRDVAEEIGAAAVSDQGTHASDAPIDTLPALGSPLGAAAVVVQ